MEIHWLGHSSFKLKGEKTIYIDPYNISDSEHADIVLVTHEHFDHCNEPDILKVSDSSTQIFITADCQSKIRNFPGKVHLVEPNNSYESDGIKIETVSSYNIGKQFHPKENDWVGYIVTLEGKRVYHAGDTDLIPEMKNFKCDIALLPCSGTYVMNASEAAQAANIIQPELAIPMHYGSIVGDKSDAEKFRELAKCKVDILEKE